MCGCHLSYSFLSYRIHLLFTYSCALLWKTVQTVSEALGLH